MYQYISISNLHSCQFLMVVHCFAVYKLFSYLPDVVKNHRLLVSEAYLIIFKVNKALESQ